MKISKTRKTILNRAVLVFAALFAIVAAAPAQETPSPFRIGEHLTYNVSFEKYNNAAFAETYVVSRGKIEGKDAVELRCRIKTLGFLSSAFYMIDESRTVFASPATGMPLYIQKTSNDGILPKQNITNNLAGGTASLDLLTLIYQIRAAGGVGSFTFSENGKTYSVTLLNGTSEKVKTDAGEFDTTVSTAASDYLTDLGIKDLKVNLATDEAHTPVAFTFATAKGKFRGVLASSTIVEPQVADPDPTPTPTPTPRPAATPRLSPTPVPYVDNEPLAEDLPFSLGETLEYRISYGGAPVGTARLQAKERTQFQGTDSVLFSAEITDVQGGNQPFSKGDKITARVNPESLAPLFTEFTFRGPLSAFSQSEKFDPLGGVTVSGNPTPIETPVGTHSLLSFIYAVRAFSLHPSKDLSNPVNDTRVAVFWNSKAYIFTLRPSDTDLTDASGKKTPALLVNVVTGEPQLDQLGFKIWLGTDAKRLPLRITLGA
ncbi:MAG TPA: DUF3108 domain-containing protein, partial [Pyrinomonadaceae bacterium]|nr:DUF3108 domain-containing protein [Pyrinomonadaceae bacterium]